MEYFFLQGVSGWRGIFGDSEESARRLLPQVALAVSSYVEEIEMATPVILVGMDTRPTSRIIAAAAVQSLLSSGAIVRFLGITAAPEIMAASNQLDGFIFVTASHNPIEHNGLKFGRQGAVLNAKENERLSEIYRKKCDAKDAESMAEKVLSLYRLTDLEVVYRAQEDTKRKALALYKASIEKIIGGVSYSEEGFCVLADFNGGARAKSIDKDFFTGKGISFITMNGEKDGKLLPVHGIIPEGENLIPLAQEMERLHKGDSPLAGDYPLLEGGAAPLIGYMCDCDGDRGNIVYWDDSGANGGSAKILEAQEVFALAALYYLRREKSEKKAIAVNCATSMRIDEVAAAVKAKVFRCEVGEANVAECAENARKNGYAVPIAGEGSNGGLITYPSKVRDPIMTVFALLALLREYGTLRSAIDAIPVYTSTGSTEERALININVDKKKLKEVFVREWAKEKDSLVEKYGITSYDVAFANGATERITDGNGDWDNGRGSVKVRLYKEGGDAAAFLWVRKSGTEDVTRLMCDVKGGDKGEEEDLLKWWRGMIEEAKK